MKFFVFFSKMGQNKKQIFAKMKKNILVTTSIAYVNGAPHIGFAMELIEADAYARWARSRGNRVLFSTGTDEHGAKIYRAAIEKGILPKDLTDQNAAKFQKLTKILNISNDDFVRTTEPRHQKCAQKIWEKIAENGDFEKKEFSGKYCVGCETFLGDRDLDENGNCPNHKTPPEKVSQKNWFFALSKYSKNIQNLIESKKMRLLPDFRAPEILEFAKSGFEDVSFSRPRVDLPWGVPVPGDDEQVMYVWCDALSNYLTVAGFPDDKKWKDFWKKGEVVHFIGKDILRFHAGIWPAMLLSAGLPPPSKICVHGFLTSEGHKMSKSLGNVVDPFAVVAEFSGNPDPLRYFLLAEVPFGRDADFTQKRFLEMYHSKLGNGLGNFLNRVLVLSKKFPAAEKSEISDEILAEKISNLPKKIDEKMKKCEIHAAISEIFQIIDFLNLDIDRQKPWILGKENPEKAGEILQNYKMALKKIAAELSNFLPATGEKIAEFLKSGKSEILFPRMETEKN